MSHPKILNLLVYLVLSFTLTSEAKVENLLNEHTEIDSLSAIINDTSSSDTSRAGAYVALSQILYVSNIDTMIFLCKKAIVVAREGLASKPDSRRSKVLQVYLAAALNNLGYATLKKGEVLEALEFYNQSKLILEMVGDSAGLATYFLSIGYIYSGQGKIPEALDLYHKSLRIHESMGNKSGMATSYNNIGFIHENQNEIKLALTFYHKTLKLREEIIRDNPGLIENLQHIATTYNNIGSIHLNQNQMEIATEYYIKSLRMREKIGDQYGIANSYNNFALIYEKKTLFDQAIKHYNLSLDLYKKLNYIKGMMTCHGNISSLFIKQGLINEGFDQANLSLKYAKIAGAPNNIRHSASLLKKIAKMRGNHKEALQMYELEIQMRDSVNNEQTQKATIRQQTKYEFEKGQLVKEQAEKEQARLLSEELLRRDNLQYSIILICILLVFVGVLGLGFIKVSPRLADGLIFFAFLILFEFLLVLTDPYVDEWTGGAPGWKLLINAVFAGLIFPMHGFFERLLRRRLLRKRRKEQGGTLGK